MYTKSDIFANDAAVRFTECDSVTSTIELAIFTANDVAVIEAISSALDDAFSATVSSACFSSYISAIQCA